MRAIQAERAGGPEVLRLVEIDTPEPGPGEARVRHHAIGLNFIDTYQRSGLYPVDYPAVLGQEAAGVVEAVGAGVSRVAVGDRVAYQGRLGAYAEAAVVPADRLVRLPAAVDFETAAGGLLKGLTAEFLARRLWPLERGDTVLVHAAAGGVGSLLHPWLTSLGVRVIAAVGSRAKAERVHGCLAVLVVGEDDLPARVRELTQGRGVKVAYDSVGRTTFDASLACLARRGLLCAFGNASGPPPALDPLRLARGGSLYLTRPTLVDYVVTSEELDAAARALWDVLARGAVKVEVGRTFPLEQARAAHEALEGRRTTGSTLLVP